MNKRVKKARNRLGLKQAAFGEKLGVTAAAISKIESGERNLTDQMILAICREFNVDEEWLRTGEGGEEAMFVESDNANITAVVSEFHLDKMSEVILAAYVDMDSPKRDALNNFIREMSDRVMNESKEKARLGINDMIINSRASETVKSDLSDKAADIFAEAFPYIGVGNADESEISPINLDERRDTVVIAAMGDGLKVVDKEKAKRDLYTGK